MSELFFVDPLQGIRVSYEQLQRDVAAVKLTQPVIAFEETYDLFCKLLAAVERQSTVILVDQAADRAVAEGLVQPQEFAGVTASGNRSTTTHSLDSPSFLTGDNRCRIGLFTSGTTGQPKLVCHGLKSLTRTVRVSEKHRNDVWGLAYRPTRFAGLQVFLQAICNQNSLIRLFELPVEQTHAAIESYGITHLSATPTYYRMLCASPIVHERIQRITVGGEIFGERLADQLKCVFPNAKILNIYASTEAGSLFAADGENLTIPNEFAQLVRIEDGELMIHRSLLAESLQRQYPQEFYATGDCVAVVSTSPFCVRITSRRSEVINVGGNKVNPHHVERILLGFAEIDAARVYGRVNSVTGSLVCCDIIPTVGTTIDQKKLREKLEQRLHAYQIPRVVNIVSKIDVSGSGKTRRNLDG